MSDLATESARLIGQQPLTYLEIAWDNAVAVAVTDLRGAAGWTNETDYLLSHKGQYRINPPGENLLAAGDVGSATIVLDNSSLRYAWQNAGAALYAYINGPVGLSGKPVRLWQGFQWDEAGTPTTDYVCIFTGVIEKFTPSTTQATITLECRDWGYRFLQNKRSSAVAVNQLPNTWIATIASGAGITATALDVGIYRIPFCWLDDESSVEEIWQTAEADGGLCYFDQAGVLRFENALHWLTHSTVAWTFTEDDYTTDDPELDVTAVATKVVVEWSGRFIGPGQVVYTSDTVKIIGPGQTETWTARYSNAVYYAVDPVAALDYRAQSVGGASLTADLTVTLTNKYAQQATVTVTNTNTFKAARLTFFQIRGNPLLGGPTEQVEKTPSVAPFPFERIRSVRGNPYVQAKGPATALAAMLAVRCGRLRPLYKLDVICGVPSLRLNDLIAFRDVRAQGAANTKQGVLLAIGWEGSLTAGFRQTLEVMDVTGLTEYGYADFFIIGVTALGTHGRTYY